LENKKNTKKTWLIADIYEWAESIITAVAAIVFIFAFIVRVTSVDGESMLPTLNDKDRMLVTDFFYEPKHNDIVVVYAPGIYDHEKGVMGKPIIKRVIGLPGETIAFDTANGIVSVNGAPLVIHSDGGFYYEDGHKINSPTYSSQDQPDTVTVPEGCVFVMGDNRGNSVDSRFLGEGQYVGFVDINYIVGKAFFKLSPLSDFGFVK